MRKKGVFLPALLAALLLLAVLGCEQGAALEEGDEGDDLIPVEVEVVSKGELVDYLELSGDVNSDGNVAVIPQVGGSVRSVGPRVGEQVERGQLLVELEGEDLLLQVRQAESRVEQARLQLDSARQVKFPRQLEQLESQLEEAEIYFKEAERSYGRLQSLYGQDVIPRAELERAETEYESARSRLESIRRQLELEREAQEAELSMLEAQLRDAQLGLESARSAYEKSRLKAPISGTVSSVRARVGDEASPGTPLLTLVDYESLYVEARITERQLEMVQEGMGLQIEVPTLGARYQGTIQEIALAPLEGTRSYPLKAYFDEPAPEVRMGQHARLLAIAREARDAVIIPRRVLGEEDGEFYAFVVEDGIARKRILELGLKTEDAVEVLSGLEEGEQLVVRGEQFLSDGAAVEIVGGNR